MAALLGKKVLIIDGKDKGNEGYVAYEDRDAITIEVPELAGAEGWFGFWYARKDMVKVMA